LGFHNGQRVDRTLKVEYAVPAKRVSQSLHPLLDGARFELSTNPRAIQVTKVVNGSKAARAGLVAGDLVISVNRRPVRDMEGFVRNLQSDPRQILMQLQRNRSIFYLVLR